MKKHLAILALASLVLLGTGCAKPAPVAETPTAESETSATAVPSSSPEACLAYDAGKHAAWSCYQVPGAYQLLYPNDWLTSGFGDAGVFVVGDVETYVNYSKFEFMPADTVETIQEEGVDSHVMKKHDALCGQTEACPTLVGTTKIFLGEEEVTLFQFRTEGLGYDQPNEGYIDDYTAATASDDAYYEMRLIIPSTVSETLRAQRLAEFTEMARTFRIEKQDLTTATEPAAADDETADAVGETEQDWPYYVYGYDKTDCVGLENGMTQGKNMLEFLFDPETEVREALPVEYSLYTQDYLSDLNDRVQTHVSENGDELYAYYACHVENADAVAGILWPKDQPLFQSSGKFAGELDTDFGNRSVLLLLTEEGTFPFSDMQTMNKTATGGEVSPCDIGFEDGNYTWTCFMGLGGQATGLVYGRYQSWILPTDGSAAFALPEETD